MRHQYSVQKRDGWDRAEFEAVVEFIYAHGTKRRFGSSSYRELTVGAWFYWCMGWKPEQTELINRKPIEAIDRRPEVEQRQREPKKPVQLRLFE
jgi:hypothetical protein